jgi:hypothetical protein
MHSAQPKAKTACMYTPQTHAQTQLGKRCSLYIQTHA